MIVIAGTFHSFFMGTLRMVWNPLATLWVQCVPRPVVVSRFDSDLWQSGARALHVGEANGVQSLAVPARPLR
jgi:hypothetical protein